MQQVFCHGFDFSSVMQKTRFFEKCGIIYVETEKTLRPLFQNFFKKKTINLATNQMFFVFLQT